MPSGPTRSILLARAVGLLSRARGLGQIATHSVDSHEIAAIELDARNVRAWLNEAGRGAVDEAETLADIDTRLKTLVLRLDEIQLQVVTRRAELDPGARR